METLSQMVRSDRLRIRQAGSKILERVANDQLRSIRRRTALGISSSGQRFTPYAPSTARRKGRREPVTLRDTGRMLSSMYVRRVRLSTYEITFRDRYNERIARFQHAGTRRRTAADQARRTPGRIRAGVVFRNTGRYHVPPRPFIEASKDELVMADRTAGAIIDSQFPDDLRRRIKLVVTA